MHLSRTIRGIVVAVAAVTVAAALRGVLTPVIGADSVPFITFYPAIALAAIYGGVASGVAATVLAAVIANYAWMPPAGDFIPASIRDDVIVALFVAGAA